MIPAPLPPAPIIPLNNLDQARGVMLQCLSNLLEASRTADHVSKIRRLFQLWGLTYPQLLANGYVSSNDFYNELAVVEGGAPAAADPDADEYAAVLIGLLEQYRLNNNYYQLCNMLQIRINQLMVPDEAVILGKRKSRKSRVRASLKFRPKSKKSCKKRNMMWNGKTKRCNKK